jgi:hypothetical protein
MPMTRWQVVLVVLIAALGLALVGSLARRRGAGGCALDGSAVEPLYQVRIVDAGGRSHTFCCLHCAELWLLAQADAPAAIHVTDEVSGQEVPAEKAWFVRSQVITQASTGNRIHTFKERQDAEKHAAAGRGRVLTGADRPFTKPRGD